MATRCAPQVATNPDLLIPTCPEVMATVTIRNPDHDWWTALHLPPPLKLIQSMVQKSGCFRVIAGKTDPNSGFFGALVGALSSNNISRGALVGATFAAPDYVLVPDIDAANSAVGGDFQHKDSSSSSYAGVMPSQELVAVKLALIDIRSASDYTVSGESYASSALSLSAPGFGQATGTQDDVEVYFHSLTGQSVYLAYADAFSKLIATVKRANPVVPASVTPVVPAISDQHFQREPQDSSGLRAWAMFTLKREAVLRSKPSPNAKALRALPAGTALWLTGKRRGSLYEVEDSVGNRGWTRLDDTELKH